MKERGEGALYGIWEHIDFTAEPLDGCLQNFEWIKNSWPLTCVRRFCKIRPGADPGRGKNRSRLPLLKQKSSSD